MLSASILRPNSWCQSVARLACANRSYGRKGGDGSAGGLQELQELPRASADGAGKRVSAPPVRKRPNTPAYNPKMFTVPPPPTVPSHITRPSYADAPGGRPPPARREEFGQVKDADMIQKMRRSNGLAAEALQHALATAKEGVTTAEVDTAVCEFLIARGAYPVGLNYHGFPRGLCASPNEVVLHGVPNTRPFESGDICNFDVTCFRDGAYGDCSAMASIGDVDEDAQRLVKATKALLDHLVSKVGPDMPLSQVGNMCREFTSGTGFGCVSEFCGHFIGRELHMMPNVLHVPNGTALPLRPGMTFTMEPILVEGSAQIVGPFEDGWTILSKNGGWSAQWEHTILITENGCEVLSQAL